MVPTLTVVDITNLKLNKRVQNQKRDGRIGNGWVVVDVKAPSKDVFSSLKDFQRYPTLIPTVRTADITHIDSATTKAAFTLSRFRLPVNVIHKIDYDQKLISFTLDPSKTNPIISKCEGYWLVQEPNDHLGYTRVWLYASIVVSRLVPAFIVDYASARALPRATEWLQKYFEDS